MAKGLHGSNGAIYIGDKPIAERTEWALNLRRDYIDASMFGPENKTYLVGRTEIEGTFSGPLDANSYIEFGDSTVFLYVPKDVTPITRLLRRLLHREELHMYASGPITYVDPAEGQFSSSTMTIYPDPGTMPHRAKVRSKRALEELRYRFWDRFLRPTVVIPMDEWQADEWEAEDEARHWEAVEAAERGYDDD